MILLSRLPRSDVSVVPHIRDVPQGECDFRLTGSGLVRAPLNKAWVGGGVANMRFDCRPTFLCFFTLTSSRSSRHQLNHILNPCSKVCSKPTRCFLFPFPIPVFASRYGQKVCSRGFALWIGDQVAALVFSLEVRAVWSAP